MRRKSVIPCTLECRLAAFSDELPQLRLRCLVALLLLLPLAWPIDDFLPDALEADTQVATAVSRSVVMYVPEIGYLCLQGSR